MSTSPLPEAIPLNEMDTLMVAVDTVFRHRTGRGNICSFVITLPVRETHEKANQHDSAKYDSAKYDSASGSAERALRRIEKSELFQWLSSLRLVGRRWRVCRVEPLREVPPLEGGIEEAIIRLDIEPRTAPPFRVDRVRGESTVLVFSWHHALLDARRGEEICRLLLLGEEPREFVKKPPKGSLRGLIKTVQESAVMRRTFFENGAPRPVALGGAPSLPCYHRIVFSAEETHRIDARARGLQMELFKSTVYLAAAARAFSSLTATPWKEGAELYIPVPHDLRRKGAPLANQLTVLFYRLQHTNSLEEAANLLLTQSQQMIERGVHKHFQSFLKAVTLLPHALLVRVLKIPTAGQFASFYFSDTGDSLSTLLEATGGVDGVHYPPHFSPPEFTVVFSRVRERQTVMVVAGMKHGTEGALDRFERELRRELLEE